MPNYNRNIKINELGFNLNSFNEQEVYYGTVAIAHKIKNLLFLKKGDFPSLPDAGINIQSYRFQAIDTLLSGKLKEELSDQVSKYVTEIAVENISISVSEYQGEFFLVIRFTLIEDDKQLIFALYQPKGDLVRFNFKIYDTEKVEIW